MAMGLSGPGALGRVGPARRLWAGAGAGLCTPGCISSTLRTPGRWGGPWGLSEAVAAGVEPAAPMRGERETLQS